MAIRVYMYLLLVSLVAPIVDAFGNESESMPVASISEASAFDLRDKWVRDNLSHHEKVPFSFFYDGVESSQMISDWIFHSEEVEVSLQKTQRTLRYRDTDSGLEIRLEATIFKSHPAIEWVLRIKNTGLVETPIISKLMALDSVFRAQDSNFFLHYARRVGEGVSAKATDLGPVRKALNPKSTLRMSSMHGRPSWGESLPVFNLEMVGEGSRQGVVIGIGWTGQWHASFRREDDSAQLQAGMEGTHLKLFPGEEIRSPKMMLLFLRHHRLYGHNLLRRLILDQYYPQSDGRPRTMPFLCSSAGLYNEAYRATETNQIRFASQFAKLGVEYLWLDVGWHDSKDGHSHLGPVDLRRFPNGLRGLSDGLRKMNMGLLTWNAPEFLGGSSWIEKEFPNLFLRPDDPDLDPKHPLFNILNFGDQNALSLITDHTATMIGEEKIGIYRMDGPIGANLDYADKQPLRWWQDADAPDRQGITQIRYVEGLYHFWDSIRKRNPNVIIDLCGGGATRIDLEAMSRCLYLWRSDNNHPGFEPEDFQAQTFGISQWLPSTGTASGYPDTYSFRSSINNGVALAWNPYQPEVKQSWALAFPVDQAPPHELKEVVRTTVDGKQRLGYTVSEPFPWEKAKQLTDEFLRIRHYYHGDFYPLTPYSTEKDVWLAFQFHRDDLNSGIVMVFRRSEAETERHHLKLWGLNADSVYEVKFEDSGEQLIQTGAELRSSLEILIAERRSSRLITYREVLSSD